MVKNLINFFIAIGFLLPQFLGFAVGFLQILQSEPYITNTGFISSFIDEPGLENVWKTSELWQSIGSVD